MRVPLRVSDPNNLHSRSQPASSLPSSPPCKVAPMAATVASSRRSTSVSSTSTQHSSSPSISKGATARSAAGPRVSSNLTPASRRNSTRLATPPPTNANGESHESLSAALRQETDAKEQARCLSSSDTSNGHLPAGPSSSFSSRTKIAWYHP